MTKYHNYGRQTRRNTKGTSRSNPKDPQVGSLSNPTISPLRSFRCEQQLLVARQLFLKELLGLKVRESRLPTSHHIAKIQVKTTLHDYFCTNIKVNIGMISPVKAEIQLPQDSNFAPSKSLSSQHPQRSHLECGLRPTMSTSRATQPRDVSRSPKEGCGIVTSCFCLPWEGCGIIFPFFTSFTGPSFLSRVFPGFVRHEGALVAFTLTDLLDALFLVICGKRCFSLASLFSM